MTASSIQARREDGDDFKDILCKFFLEGRTFTLMDNHDFEVALHFAAREHQVSTEAEQSVLVRQDKPFHVTAENHLQQVTESFFIAVHARAEVPDELSAPAFRCAVGNLQHLMLEVEVIFLVPR